jgi:hypothetical protein
MGWVELCKLTSTELMGIQVLAGDKDVGHLLPIPTDTMQLFDECRGGLISLDCG